MSKEMSSNDTERQEILHKAIEKWDEATEWFVLAADNSRLEQENAALCKQLARAQQEQPNDPLTLEEIRAMDGEPVWVQDLLISKCSVWHFAINYGGEIRFLMLLPLEEILSAIMQRRERITVKRGSPTVANRKRRCDRWKS